MYSYFFVFFFPVHIPFFWHESTLHSFFCFALFVYCTSLISFCYFFSFFFHILFKDIRNHTKFLQLNLIHSSVYIGTRFHLLHFLHHVLCVFVYLIMLFDFQVLFFNTSQKLINSVG